MSNKGNMVQEKTDLVKGRWKKVKRFEQRMVWYENMQKTTLVLIVSDCLQV